MLLQRIPTNIVATLELGNAVETGRILRCMLEKAEVATKGVLKGNSSESSERKQDSWRKTPLSS